MTAREPGTLGSVHEAPGPVPLPAERPPSYADAKPPRSVEALNLEHAALQAMLADIQRVASRAAEDRPRLVPPPLTWGAAFAAALAEAQGRVSMVAKDAKNTHLNYKYASAESLIEEARGAMSASGLSVLAVGSRMVPEDHPIVMGDKGKPLARVLGRLHVDYLMLHKSGEYMTTTASTPVILEAGKPEDKAEATAATYNLGYMLRGLMLLSRGEDGGADARDDRDHEPARDHRRPEPAPEDDKPTATELEASAKFAAANTLEEHAAAAKFAMTLVNSGQIGARARARLSNQGRARAAELAAAAKAGADPSTGEVAPEPQDWGDRAELITRHARDATGVHALGVASLELEKAQQDGMPAALVAPIGSLLLDRRKALESAAALKLSRQRAAEEDAGTTDGRAKP